MRKKTIESIWQHVKSEYPKESCGVIAVKGRIERYFKCRNLAIQPTEQFSIAPEDYANAEDWGEVIAIVHSHPDATTQPSELDKSMCDATNLTWHIFSYPEGDIGTIQPRGILPLLGRQFVLGHSDCYGLIMDYFKLEHGIEIPDYRVDYRWWESGENRYEDNFADAGFVEVDSPQIGDVIIMQVQADVPNHAGVLVEGNMLLHHLYGQLSQRIPYGGYYRDRTIRIVRHKSLI